MFKWSYSEKVTTDATAEQVWAIWEQAELWPSWDSELVWVKLDGPFKAGTQGKMQPVGGPVVEFTLTEVEVNRKFIDRARLPLTTLDFAHFYEHTGDKEGTSYIRHSVTMTGLLAPLFGFILGRKIKKHLRGAMEDLSQKATQV
ncbi:SRPBCC family protein [Vibrio cholerae]|uniref:SRPBCC family protein n=1 Tax=Vibrio cholerae TaxID=666 RepID=UPI0028B6EF44|nr:SRPBCC family protein [Vibrio cholerae]MDV2382394.1 SRPBCC family protein [Vibrio cholerae]HDI3197774.1 SRPBCC family protein [Vibrio cholerae]HDI3200955.1 SRPBCC family protein [Vibrio cholerae]HDI3321967.1 SRPBCC family protein [Vibrio cholerae]HDZ3742062.1 SRPBCC family protein [Vibrio cholerae]